MQYRRAIGCACCHFMAAGTQAEQADVHQRQANTGDQAGNDGITGDQLGRLDATGADGVHDHDAEHQCAQGIHGQVTIDKALGERGGDVFGGCYADITRRQGNGSNAENGQGDDFQRGEKAPYRVQQATRVQRHKEHDQEVHRAVQKQRQRAFTGQGGQAHFERYGGGTRGSEQRANSQIGHSRQQAAGDLADRAAQCIHAAADLGQGNNGDYRQADCGDQEAQCGHPDVRSGLQANDWRENDVASPNEQGKGHKPKCQDVLAFQYFHYGNTTLLNRNLEGNFPCGCGKCCRSV